MTACRAWGWATAAFLLWATCATGVTSEEALHSSQHEKVFGNSTLLRTVRHLQNQGWDPLSDYWTEEAENTGSFPRTVSISRNGECVTAVSHDKIYVNAIMPDGTLVKRGEFSPYSDTRSASWSSGIGAISLSTDCAYIGVLYTQYQGEVYPDIGTVAVYKYASENDWVQVGRGISPPRFSTYSTYQVSVSDDGNRTIFCRDNCDTLYCYEEGEGIDFCQVYHFLDGNWAPLGQPLSLRATISADGRIVGTRDSAFKLDESGSSPLWKEVNVDRDGARGIASHTELSHDGEVIANTYVRGGVLVFRWDPASQSYQQMGNPIYGFNGESCGGSDSLSLSSDGRHVAVSCDGQGYAMALDFDEDSDKWTHVGLPNELSSEVEDGIRGDSVAMSGDGTRLIIGSSSEKRARVYLRQTDQSGIFEVPSDATVECGEGIDSSETGKAVATGTDECPMVEITESDSTVHVGCGRTKTIKRKWEATDSCGNVRDAIQRIKVVDTTPPELTVPVETIIVRCGKAPHYTSGVVAIDSCEGMIDRSKFNTSDDSVDINAIGLYPFKVGVSDSCGNTGELERFVRVPYKINGGGVLGNKVKRRSLSQRNYDFDFERYNCPSSLTNSSGTKIPLKIRIRDCQGNAYATDRRPQPRVYAIYKVLPDRLKRTSITPSGNLERPMKFNRKKPHKWRYVLNETDLRGPGCYLAEFFLPFGGYATANFVLK